MNIYFTLIVFCLLGLNYIISTYIIYYEKENINEDRIIQLKNFQKKLTVFSVVLILTGFSLYLNEKYKEYGDNFSLKTFIFGVLTCDGLK